MGMRAIGASSLAVLALACGSPPPADAGVDGGPSDAGPEPFTPTPVLAAAPPVLTPCPLGWRQIPGAGFDECDPWPEAGRQRCGPNEAHFVGEPGCARIGEACPADGLPRDLPAGALYVRPGATAGDGSRDAPFGTVAEAMAVASSGAVIGLAVGSYDERVVTTDLDLTFVGACVDTVVEPTGVPAFAVFGPSLTLRNLRVRGAAGGILARDSEVHLESVIFEDMGDSAVAAGRGTFDAHDLVVRRVSSGGLFFSDVDATLERVVVEDVVGQALGSRGGSLVARAIAIDGASGSVAGFVSAIQTSVTLEQAFLTADPLTSMIASASSLTLTDTVVEAPVGATSTGLVLLAAAESALLLERVRFLRGSGLVVGVADPGTTATIRDVVVRDVLDAGHALEVGDGARAELSRVWIERSGANGVLLFAAGTEVFASDLTVRASQPDRVGMWGRGIGVQTGASLEAQRVALEGHHEISLVVASEGTVARIFDLTVTDTLERGCAVSGCAPAGIGVGAYLGGSLRAERFVIERSALVGVQLATDGRVELADGVVSDNPIGVNLQVPGYDVTRLLDRVQYRSNGVNLESSELYVPEPTAP